MNYVNFIRMEKSNTGSFLTLETPNPMPFDEAAYWAEQELPGWEAICGSLTNPDEGNVQLL